MLSFLYQPSGAEGEADSRQPVSQAALGRAVGKLCHFSPRELYEQKYSNILKLHQRLWEILMGSAQYLFSWLGAEIAE